MTKVFDCVIGNPPYDAPIPGTRVTKKIWPALTVLATTLVTDAGYLGWVIPSAWLKTVSGTPGRVRTVLTTNFDTVRVDFDANRHFRVGVEIVYAIAIRQPYVGRTRVHGRQIDNTQDIRNGLAPTPHESFVQEINRKIIESGPRILLGNADREMQGIHWQPNPDSTHRYRCRKSSSQTGMGYINRPTKNRGILKIGLNVSAQFYNPNSPDRNMPITRSAFGHLMFYLPLRTRMEGLRYREYFSSRPIRFLCRTHERRNGWCIAVKFSRIPDYDVINCPLDDRSLYRHFGFTRKEIEYIESIIT